MAEPLPKRQCGNCRFWLGGTLTGAGTCHGAPPTAILVAKPDIAKPGNLTKELVSAWPPVGMDELCGMWTPTNEFAAKMKETKPPTPEPE
jgi:hypothetical protein